MKHKIILTTSILAALSVRIETFAEGYFVDPALLGLFITPLIILSLAFIPIVVAIVYIVRFIRGKKTAENVRLTLVSLCGLIVLPFIPLLPSSMDAFVYRMEQFPREAYYNLADDLRAEFKRLGIQGLGGVDSKEKEWDAVYELLRPSHPILQVNRFKPYMTVDDDSVIVFWGSGLTGAYEIIILEGNEKPHWLESTQRPVVYIYEDVGLGFRS